MEFPFTALLDNHGTYGCTSSWTHVEQGRLVGYVLVRDTVLSIRAELLGHRQEVVERGEVGEVAWGQRSEKPGSNKA